LKRASEVLPPLRLRPGRPADMKPQS
jgi:hypothetical protein